MLSGSLCCIGRLALRNTALAQVDISIPMSVPEEAAPIIRTVWDVNDADSR